MTVSNSKLKINANGTGVQTNFPYDFLVLDSSHMLVYLDSVLYVGAYVVNGVGTPAGGSVDITVPPALGVIVTLYRQVPETQLTDYAAYRSFPSETLEQDLDLSVMRSTQNAEVDNRTLKAAVGDDDGTIDYTIPAPVAGALFAWDVTGKFLEMVAPLAGSTILNDDTMASLAPDQATSVLSIVNYIANNLVNYHDAATMIAATGATLVGSTDGVLQIVLDSYKGRLDAVEVAQASDTVGYTTQAQLFADLAHDAGTRGYVNNDNLDPEDNGDYLKLGASGVGSWDPNPNDRITILSNDVDHLEATTVNSYDTSLNEQGNVDANTGVLHDFGPLYLRSGFQALLPNTEYTLAGYSGICTARIMCIYDAGLVFLEDPTQTADHVGDSFTFTTPATAAFIMFNVRFNEADPTVFPPYIMLLLGAETPTHYIRHETAEAYPLVTQTDFNFTEIANELAALKAMVIPVIWNSVVSRKGAWYRDYLSNKVLVMGDSFVRGTGATDPDTGAWPVLLDTQLKSILGDGGGGFYGVQPFFAYDSPNLGAMVFVGSWNALPEIGPFRYAKWGFAPGSTATIDVIGDTVAILYADSTSSDPFTVTVDGGAPESFALSEFAGGPFAGKLAIVDTGDTGSHTIVVTTTNYIVFAGIIGYNSSVPGSVAVHQMGREGSTSANFGGLADVWEIKFMDQIAPQVTILALGINDWLTQKALVDYRANMEALIVKAQLSGRVLLVNNVEFSLTAHVITMPDYNAELLSLAQEYDCYYLDMHTRWGGSTAAAFALGFQPTAAGGHPTDAGHEDFRDAVYDVLMDVD